MSDESNRVYLGMIDAGSHIIFIPKSTLQPAERLLDRAREKRLAAANRPKAQALQLARARGRLKRALRACLGRGR